MRIFCCVTIVFKKYCIQPLVIVGNSHIFLARKFCIVEELINICFKPIIFLDDLEAEMNSRQRHFRDRIFRDKDHTEVDKIETILN